MPPADSKWYHADMAKLDNLEIVVDAEQVKPDGSEWFSCSRGEC